MFSLDFLDDDESEAVVMVGSLTSNAELVNDTLTSTAAKPEVPDTPNTTADSGVHDAIKNLVTSRFSSLQANPLNYHGYLQGQVIERIFEQVIELFLNIYSDQDLSTSGADAEQVFKRCAEKFTTIKEDMLFIKNHLVNLIERIIRLQTDGVTNKGSNGEIIIPFIAIRRPPSRYRRRRFQRELRVDELVRINKARVKQERSNRRYENHTSALQRVNQDVRQKRKYQKILNEYECHAKRLMGDIKSMPGLDFDDNAEEQHEELDIEPMADEPVVEPPVNPSPKKPAKMPLRSPTALKPKPCTFSTRVEVISQRCGASPSISFSANTQTICANKPAIRMLIAPLTEIQKSIRRNIDITRRKELREHSHVRIEPPKRLSSHGGAAGARQMQARQAERKRRRQPIAYRSHSSRDGSRSDCNVIYRNRLSADRDRQENLSADDWLSDDEFATSEDNDAEENYEGWDVTASRFVSKAVGDSDTSTDDDDVLGRERQQDHQEAESYSSDDSDYFEQLHYISAVSQLDDTYEKPLGRVIVGELRRQLKSCCLKRFFASNTRKTVRYADGPPEVRIYEDENVSICCSAFGQSDKHTVVTNTQIFTKPKPLSDANLRRNKNNRIMLPHSDELSEISKRTDPRYMHASALREHYAELQSAMTELDTRCQINNRISRWFICDMLLDAIDDEIFQNAHVTRIQFPKLPTWLVSEGMTSYENNKFPSSISRIFVSCAYDIQLLHADDDSLIPMDFLRNLHEWMRKHVARRNIIPKMDKCPEGDRWMSTVQRIMPIIVAINIPEIGDRERQFRVFNEKLSKFIDTLNEQHKVRQNGLIELFDWAKCVRECDDRSAMSTVEGRTRLLISALKKEYGLLYR